MLAPMEGDPLQYLCKQTVLCRFLSGFSHNCINLAHFLPHRCSWIKQKLLILQANQNLPGCHAVVLWLVIVEVMKFCCGNHFLSEKEIRAERIRLDAAWSDYRAVGQAVVLTVMELLDSKCSVTISQQRADQSLRATLFGLAPVWYRAQVAGGAIGGTPISRWTSHQVWRDTWKWNTTCLQTFRKARLSVRVGPTWNSPATFIHGLLLNSCGIYRRSKREPGRRRWTRSHKSLIYYTRLRLSPR